MDIQGRNSDISRGLARPGGGSDLGGIQASPLIGWLWARRLLLSMLGLTLVGFFLRAFWVDATSVQGDEAFTILFSLPPPPQLLFDVAGLEPNPPLMYVLFHYLMRVAGSTGFSVRYLSVVSGTLCIPLIYQLGRRLLAPRGLASGLAADMKGRIVGLAAALLMAVNQFEVSQAHTVRNYTLWPALSMASLILLLDALHTDRRRSWVGYAVTALLSLLTHYVDAFLVVFQNLYILLFWLIPGRQVGEPETASERASGREGDGENLRSSSPALPLSDSRPHRLSARLRLLLRWVPIQLGLLIVYIPWLWLAQRRLREYDPIGDNPAPADMVRRLLSSLVAGHATPDDVARWLVPLVGLLVVWGLFQMARRDREAFKFLALYLLVASIIVFVLGQLRGYFVERYLTGTLPAYLLAIAYGLVGQAPAVMGQESSGRRASSLLASGSRLLGGAVLVVLVMASARSLQVYVTSPSVSAANDWRGIAGYLLKVGQPGDVIVQNYPDPSLRYYYELLYRGPMPVVVMPNELPPAAETTDPALRELIGRYRRIWFLPQRSAWWDSKGYVEKWLNREATRTMKDKVAGFDVALYQGGAVPGPSVSLATPWRLGDAVELTGYDLAINGSPASGEGPVQLRPGDVLELALYWRASGKPDANYTVFTHVEDNRGAIVAQHDSQPVNGSRRTSRWQPGDVIRDSYVLEVNQDARPGHYALKVGMYQVPSFERLVATAPDGHQPVDRAINLIEADVSLSP